MLTCTTPNYNVLYARWLRNPGTMLDMAEFCPDSERLLDLCGGTGAASIEALRRGARQITLVDLNPRFHHPKVRTVRADVNKLGSLHNIGQFDVCIVRQALGYLDLRRMAANLTDAMPPGSRLVFNTFVRPRWKASIYHESEQLYAELSGYLRNQVAHAQIRLAAKGPVFDVSMFRHHSHSDIERDLAPEFLMVKCIESGSSRRYLFVKS